MAYNNKERKIIIGEVYPNKYGDLKIIERVDKSHVLIEFLDENIFGEHTRRIVKAMNIIYSSIKDPYRPTIYGVACKGNAPATINNVKPKEYIVWFSMISKTYGPNGNSYNSVCKEWLCYELFLQDVSLIENYNEWYNTDSEYTLVKIHGYEEWNLESCMFIKNDLAQLIKGHGGNFSTPYLGVSVDGSVFRCTINGETYGRFNNAIAAANMFNLVARHRGYPERVLNKVPYMDIAEIMKYKSLPNRKNGKFEILRTLDYRTQEQKDAALVPIEKHIWKNHGDPVRIINDRKSTNGTHYVDVEFINPNMYDEHTVVEKVAFGQLVGDYSAVVDYYKPNVLGVGCRGYGASYFDENGNRTREFILWYYLLSKCYNPNDKSYAYYGSQGVTVSHRWLCFEFFYNDLPKIQNYQLWKNNPGEYSLDKDYLQQNIPIHQKVYSLETCIFLTNQDNNAEKQLRLAKQNHTGPIGVYKYKGKSDLYQVSVNNRYYGVYDDINAATSMYNKIARSNGRGEEFVNKIDREMSLGEIAQHQVLLENESPMLCRLVNPNKSAEDYKREFIEKLYGKK